MAYDLEFEKPLAELEKKIISLQRKGDRLKPDEYKQLQEAERELRRRTEEIYKNLSSWETVQVARHNVISKTAHLNHNSPPRPVMKIECGSNAFGIVECEVENIRWLLDSRITSAN